MFKKARGLMEVRILSVTLWSAGHMRKALTAMSFADERVLGASESVERFVRHALHESIEGSSVGAKIVLGMLWTVFFFALTFALLALITAAGVFTVITRGDVLMLAVILAAGVLLTKAWPSSVMGRAFAGELERRMTSDSDFIARAERRDSLFLARDEVKAISEIIADAGSDSKRPRVRRL